jgi:hypothetical protein
MSLWIKFKNNFKDIICDIPEFNKLYEIYSYYEYNLLLYSYIGYPIELLIDELIKKKFNITHLNKKELVWNKNVIYYENQYFFEIDLNNPNIPNDYSFLTEMILFIIKNKPVVNNKHLIILKNIDKLGEYAFAFRIILEKYYNNVYFICTTHKISKIESPIKSRFSLIRLRLFTENEITLIFNKYLQQKQIITNNRNIIFCIFLCQVNINEPELITHDFCNFNYPLINKFIQTKYDLYDIRQLSYKLSQYNLSISNITMDLIKIFKHNSINNVNSIGIGNDNDNSNGNDNDKKILKIIEVASEIDYILTISNKGREPIYIESFLCQILI